MALPEGVDFEAMLEQLTKMYEAMERVVLVRKAHLGGEGQGEFKDAQDQTMAAVGKSKALANKFRAESQKGGGFNLQSFVAENSDELATAAREMHDNNERAGRAFNDQIGGAAVDYNEAVEISVNGQSAKASLHDVHNELQGPNDVFKQAYSWPQTGPAPAHSDDNGKVLAGGNISVSHDADENDRPWSVAGKVAPDSDKKTTIGAALSELNSRNGTNYALVNKNGSLNIYDGDRAINPAHQTELNKIMISQASGGGGAGKASDAFWQGLVSSGHIEGDPKYYSSGEAKPEEYKNAFETALASVDATGDQAEKDKFWAGMVSEGLIEGDPAYYATSKASAEEYNHAFNVASGITGGTVAGAIASNPSTSPEIPLVLNPSKPGEDKIVPPPAYLTGETDGNGSNVPSDSNPSPGAVVTPQASSSGAQAVFDTQETENIETLKNRPVTDLRPPSVEVSESNTPRTVVHPSSQTEKETWEQAGFASKYPEEQKGRITTALKEYNRLNGTDIKVNALEVETDNEQGYQYQFQYVDEGGRDVTSKVGTSVWNRSFDIASNDGSAISDSRAIASSADLTANNPEEELWLETVEDFNNRTGSEVKMGFAVDENGERQPVFVSQGGDILEVAMGYNWNDELKNTEEVMAAINTKYETNLHNNNTYGDGSTTESQSMAENTSNQQQERQETLTAKEEKYFGTEQKEVVAAVPEAPAQVKTVANAVSTSLSDDVEGNSFWGGLVKSGYIKGDPEYYSKGAAQSEEFDGALREAWKNIQASGSDADKEAFWSDMVSQGYIQGDSSYYSNGGIPQSEYDNAFNVASGAAKQKATAEALVRQANYDQIEADNLATLKNSRDPAAAKAEAEEQARIDALTAKEEKYFGGGDTKSATATPPPTTYTSGGSRADGVSATGVSYL